MRQGRPMGPYCQPNTTANGMGTGWGSVTYEKLFGPEGWCMAAQPVHQCDCYYDGACVGGWVGGWVQLGMDLCCIATQFLPSRLLQLAVQLHLEPAELQFDWLGDAAGWGGTNCEEPYEQVGWGVCLLGRH